MTPALTTLVSFGTMDGQNSNTALIVDAAGDLFGTTLGGANGDGQVFEITSGTLTVLASFSGMNGNYPQGNLIADTAGDLFGTTEHGGTGGGYGTVFELAKTSTGYSATPTVLASFNGSDGGYPMGSLIADTAGDLFGTTYAGGSGTVFEIVKGSTGYSATPQVLAAFNGTDGQNPSGSLIADAAGNLFGTTYSGGANDKGTVFEIMKTGDGYSSTPIVLASFNGADGSGPAGGLVVDAAGDLFGTTGLGGAYGQYGDGTVFEITKTATGYSNTPTVLVSFDGTDGANPQGTLIVDGAGDLFGSTNNGGTNHDGTVFEIANTSSGYSPTPTVLESFNSTDGTSPTLSAADAGGDLFGTTYGGGANSDGTVFEITDSGFVVDPITIAGTREGQTTSSYVPVDPFASATITDPNLDQTETVTVTPSTTLYGTLSDPNAATDGSLDNNGTFKLAGTAAEIQSDLQGLVFTPVAGQSGSTGFTIGVTDTLGATATDTTTSVVTTTPALTTLVSFGTMDGQNSNTALIVDAAGDLFGTTLGGANGDGQVFEITSGTLTVLASFSGMNGNYPQGNLIADTAGDLFGTTEHGGTGGGYGTVFELAKTSTGYSATPTVLASFNGSDGGYPMGSLIADTAGDLFGTTYAGGSGTVFEIVKGSTGYSATPQVLAAFNGTDGQNPSGSLIADAAGDLFGTTYSGGANDKGTVFEIMKTGDGYSSTPIVLASFNGADGSGPAGGLVVDAAGDLFGTTGLGGAYGQYGDGTVFEITKTATGYSNTPTVLVSFDGTDGANPQGTLIVDGAGDLFGSTNNGGTDSRGTVFEVANTSSGYSATPTVLESFNTTDGSGPTLSTADAAGDLFGTTYEGGANSEGTVFEVTDSGYEVVCFCSGTRILTADGEVVVEDLAVGDLVVTASGAHRPIRWLGHRTMDCRNHSRPEEAHPIRVARHAFGENTPAQDLYLSPAHSLCVDMLGVGDVLVPVCALANGSTIVQIEVDQVTYWHVELDSHDIIIANGLQAESYIDMGNRAFFIESNIVAFGMRPDADYLDPAARTHADFCRPFVDRGPLLDAARLLLHRRAVSLGWALDTSHPLADLHLIAEGTRIDPIVRGFTARFAVPAGAGDLWLVSTTARPSDVKSSGDKRHLGVSVAALAIDDGFDERITIALDHSLLNTGFHRFEEGWRWTAGRARLPAALWDSYQDGFFLRVQLTGPALQRWVRLSEQTTAAYDQAHVPLVKMV